MLLICSQYLSEFVLQKIIPFHEVTSVKRAKTAGIFPNAIEIFAGGKKVNAKSVYHFSPISFPGAVTL